MNLFCPWDSAHYLIFSANVPAILYYALLPGMIISLVFSIILSTKSKDSRATNSLLYISISFFVWGVLALILFATNNPDQVLFYWSLTILIEPLIYLLSVFFTYRFLYDKSFSVTKLLLLLFTFLPIVVLLPTKLNLIGVNLYDCTAIEGPMALYYSYGLEFFYSIIIIITIFYKFKKFDYQEKLKRIYFAVGMLLFLLTFSSGNIIGSFTDNWVASQYGYFGMPIFIGFLSYLIVKFKSFNIKLISTQVLVIALGFLVLSMAFITDIQNVKSVVAFTLLFVLLLGRTLIKSVKKEVDQRERLEVLRVRLEESNTKLESANDKLKDLDKLKTEFLSLASHQLRSPLTAIKGYASMVLEGDFGEVNPQAKDAVDRIFQSSQNLAKVVEDLLNVSKIEQGGMKYEMAPFSLTEVAGDMAKDLSITAQKRGLKLSFTSDDSALCMVNGDKEKIRQVVLNFIDNSIKYTKEGSIEVSVKKDGDKVHFAVKDTGMGMTPEIMDTLFQKFSRGDGARMNTGGSGLGLYLAKEIVEAHKGRVFLASDGPGHGSTFGMELDAIK